MKVLGRSSQSTDLSLLENIVGSAEKACVSKKTHKPGSASPVLQEKQTFQQDNGRSFWKAIQNVQINLKQFKAILRFTSGFKGTRD